VFVYRDDIHLPQLDLWLDPRRPRPRAFISHAHGDHIGRHEWTLTTPATARLLRHRLGGALAIDERPFGESFDLGPARAKLHPAGHILGAAQLEIEQRGERLVYTGDFRLKPSATVGPAAPISCDTLIMECTFGRPHCRFPPREQVFARFVEEVVALWKEGRTPVLLAYALGRSQELLKLLQPVPWRVHLARPIYQMVKVYEELGIEFGPYELARPGASDGALLVVPPHWGRSELVRRARAPCRIALTGWAADGRPPYAADRCLPFSDHADFDELVEYVETARPRAVYTLQAEAMFLAELRARGFSAHPVESKVWMG